MNFKILSQALNFLPPEFLHKLFVMFLKTNLFKKEVEFDCQNCGHHNKITIEGVQGFFT